MISMSIILLLSIIFEYIFNIYLNDTLFIPLMFLVTLQLVMSTHSFSNKYLIPSLFFLVIYSIMVSSWIDLFVLILILFIIIKFNKNFNYNLFGQFILLIFNILIYRTLVYFILVLFGKMRFDLFVFLKGFYSSISFNIIFLFILYLVFNRFHYSDSE